MAHWTLESQRHSETQYSQTGFVYSCLPKEIESGPTISAISIDHLPTLLPRASSESSSSQELHSLLQLKDRETAKWVGRCQEAVRGEKTKL